MFFLDRDVRFTNWSVLPAVPRAHFVFLPSLFAFRLAVPRAQHQTERRRAPAPRVWRPVKEALTQIQARYIRPLQTVNR